jgi:hypothetical protein
MSLGELSFSASAMRLFSATLSALSDVVAASLSDVFAVLFFGDFAWWLFAPISLLRIQQSKSGLIVVGHFIH